MKSPNNLLGYETNGTWNGLIEMLLKNEIDIAVTPVPIIPEIHKLVDLTLPFKKEKNAILASQILDIWQLILNIFMPFDLNLWVASMGKFIQTPINQPSFLDHSVCILGSIVFITLILHMLYKYYAVYGEKWFAVKQSVELKDEQTLLFNLRQCFFYAFGRFFNQGLEFETQHLPSRIVVVSWSLFTIVTVASYTANLTAFLTNSQSASFMNNLNDLVRLNRYKPYLLIGSSTDYYLRVV